MWTLEWWELIIKSQASWRQCYVQKYNVYQLKLIEKEKYNIYQLKLIEKEKLSLHNHWKIKTVTFHKHQ